MQYDRHELTDEARKVYAGARKVAAIVWEHFTPRVGDHDKPWAEDGRWEKPNPFLNQTAHGLFLEFDLGTPNQLWTPWGKWTFLGSGNVPGEEVVKEVMTHLTTTLHAEKSTSRGDVVGPVYAVLTVEGEELPEPTLIAGSHQYLEYEPAREMWDRLTADWCEANGIEPPGGRQ